LSETGRSRKDPLLVGEELGHFVEEERQEPTSHDQEEAAMKRLVVVEVETDFGSDRVCSPLCQWIRPLSPTSSCILFEKPLKERGPRYVRLDECIAAQVKPGDEVG